MMIQKNSKMQVTTGEQPQPLFPLKGYVILNLIFWAYCIVQMAALRWLFKDSIGLYFFFTVLGAGFTIVSVFDYIYDRIAARIPQTSDEKEKNA